ncbi:MAG: STAS domain-containing protein [Planctomycetota bacterium]|jgi:anti-anti-sigma factor
MGLSDFKPRYITATAHGEANAGGFVVVTFNVSHINDEENIEELGHELFALADQFDYLRIILDLSAVEYVTSSVVGKMITLHRKLHRANGMLVICELTPGVEEVLNASRLLSYFNHAQVLEYAKRLLDPNTSQDDTQDFEALEGQP